MFQAINSYGAISMEEISLHSFIFMALQVIDAGMFD